MDKNHFIVLEGIDGSGKATQSDLLIKKLEEDGYTVRKIDFPRYEDNFFGQFIGDCIAGKHGDFVNTDPYITSVLYGADRWESKKQIKEWLKKDYIVVADRYVGSNQIHQGGKIKDSAERKKFLQWLEKMEYEVFKLPRPGLLVFLDMKVDLSLSLLNKQDLEEKSYLQGAADLLEASRDYLSNSRQAALKIGQNRDNWRQVSCYKEEVIRSREEIHDEVYSLVKKFL